MLVCVSCVVSALELLGKEASSFEYILHSYICRESGTVQRNGADDIRSISTLQSFKKARKLN